MAKDCDVARDNPASKVDSNPVPLPPGSPHRFPLLASQALVQRVNLNLYNGSDASSNLIWHWAAQCAVRISEPT